MLFDFVRASYDSPRKAFTDLSRRLRDGVSFEKRSGLFGTATGVTNLHRSWIAAAQAGRRKARAITHSFMLH